MKPIEISGELALDAELRFTPSKPSHAVLVLRFRCGRGFPIEATQDLGPSEQVPQAVQDDIRRLRRGTTVRIQTAGLQPRTDHADAILRAVGVLGVHMVEQEPRHAA